MQAATLRSAPAALPWNATGRSPGLRADAVKHPETTPSHACGTVAVSGFCLAYRCGGSAGIFEE